MWCFTDLGFYSINRTPDGALLQFRARRRQDLTNLKKAFPEDFLGREIMKLPAADYRWRLEVTAHSAGIVLCALTERIQYRNFKSHLHGTDQADKLPILHDLWAALHAYQHKQPGGRERQKLTLFDLQQAEEQRDPEPPEWVGTGKKKRRSKAQREADSARAFYDESLARP